MNVPVTVEGQRMILPDASYRYSPGSQKFIKFAFDLSEDWDGLTVFAQFSQNGVAYNSYLDENNCAYLPREIKTGQCLMMIYGTNGNDLTIGTSLPVRLCIADSGYVEDASSTGITRTLYMQLIDDLQEQYDEFVSGANSRLYQVEQALSGKANANHNHDSRYYTETEMDTKLSNKVNTSDVATLDEVRNALGI